jgi:hypothetical protein
MMLRWIFVSSVGAFLFREDITNTAEQYPSDPTALIGLPAKYQQCLPGHFGPYCERKCQCTSSAQECDDGPSGSGLCVCASGRSSRSCNYDYGGAEAVLLSATAGCSLHEYFVPRIYSNNVPAIDTLELAQSFADVPWFSGPPPSLSFDNETKRFARETPETSGTLATPTPLSGNPGETNLLFVDAVMVEDVVGLNWKKVDVEQFRLLLATARWPLGKALPFCHAYGGDQYGDWSLLGDGRAMSLGFVGRQKWELSLKGAGRTAFTKRGGDGRATLRGTAREALG